MKKYILFITWFAIGGALIPQFYFTAKWVMNKYQIINYYLDAIVYRSMLVLWPSSLLGVGDTRSMSWQIIGMQFYLTCFNIGYYIIVGTFVWLGLNKSMIYIYFITLIIILFWWKLMTM